MNEPQPIPTLTDDRATVRHLQRMVGQFVRERHWEQFHNPKNLAMSLAIEAAEVMEHFQWERPEEADAIAMDPDARSAVAEELADVLAYLLGLAARLGIDLSSALELKMQKNARRFPVESARGRARIARPSG
jgi:NTP pyrophosphatase (non-canonical NTP hydrolase)